MTHDGSFNDINIRAVMITKAEGDVFLEYLKKHPSETIKVKLCFPMDYTYFG